jgi:hypothetical protein
VLDVRLRGRELERERRREGADLCMDFHLASCTWRVDSILLSSVCEYVNSLPNLALMALSVGFTAMGCCADTPYPIYPPAPIPCQS